jgi:hypothetical protein
MEVLMKRVLFAAALVILSMGTSRLAFADPDLELVAGSDVILFDGTTLSCYNGTTITTGAGSANCLAFGAGTLGGGSSLTVEATNFNGWNLSNATGKSFSPNCGPVCVNQNTINTINAGATVDLQAFFGASGFKPVQALTVSESGTDVQGTATAMGYAYTGALGFSQTAAPVVSGQIGSTLVLTTAPATAGPTGGASPGSTFNAVTSLTFDHTGTEYNVTETIAAVPEPTNVVLFGSVLLAVTGLAKKKFRRC